MTCRGKSRAAGVRVSIGGIGRCTKGRGCLGICFGALDLERIVTNDGGVLFWLMYLLLVQWSLDLGSAQ